MITTLISFDGLDLHFITSRKGLFLSFIIYTFCFVGPDENTFCQSPIVCTNLLEKAGHLWLFTNHVWSVAICQKRSLQELSCPQGSLLGRVTEHPLYLYLDLYLYLYLCKS